MHIGALIKYSFIFVLMSSLKTFALATISVVTIGTMASFTLNSNQTVATVKSLDMHSYHIQGKIIDKATGLEVGGATIQVLYQSKDIANNTSGETGEFELKFDHTKKFTGAELVFIIKREGYETKRVPNVPCQPGVPVVVNFKIEREPFKFKKDPHHRRWETYEYLKKF